MISTFIGGAHNVIVKKYDDLTTTNTAIAEAAKQGIEDILINYWNWSPDGKPSKPARCIPQEKVPGIEISGMFDHSRFVIRIPDQWNGKLIVSAAGGYMHERSMDIPLSDYVLGKKDDAGASYAYACTDKGTIGEIIPAADGNLYPEKRSNTALLHPDLTLMEWHLRMKQLTIATKNLLAKIKGMKPIRTYISGASNGGYVTRYALENDGDLYDGGLELEGVLWTPDVNYISTKVDQLRYWKILKDPNTSQEDKVEARAMYGFPPESDFIMELNIAYGLAFPDAFRMKYDPTYKYRDWWEYNKHPEDYDHYNWNDRPQEVKQALLPISLTGDLPKPLISLAGTWDVQINPKYHAVGYDNLIKSQGKGAMHRLYLIERGNHLDGFVGNPAFDKDKQLQPLVPYYHQGFDLLINWVENGILPPENKTIGVPQIEGKAINLITSKEY